METALYKHYSEDGNLLYVGISLSAVQRTCQHKIESPWFRKIARIEIQYFPSRDEALREERRQIKDLSPAFNIRHSAKHKKERREKKQKEIIAAKTEKSKNVSFRLGESPAYSLKIISQILGIKQREAISIIERGEINLDVYNSEGYMCASEGSFLDYLKQKGFVK